MQPYEILADPYTIYLAPVGTPFPAIDDDEQDFIAGGSPGGEWFRLGSSGNRNYEEGGVTITPEQETSEFRGAGETAPQLQRSRDSNVPDTRLTRLSDGKSATCFNGAGTPTSRTRVGARRAQSGLGDASTEPGLQRPGHPLFDPGFP